MTPIAKLPTDDCGGRTESEVGRADRLARGRALLAQAREDATAGQVIADEEVDAWVNRFARGEPLPAAPPESRIE